MRFRVLVVVLLMAGLAVWVGIHFSKPVKADLRKFDPARLATLETEMWHSYYDGERFRLFRQLAGLLQEQYHMRRLQSYLVAFHAAKAAFVFKDGKTRADYERALPDLITYYAAIRDASVTPFDVDRAATLELEWWIVHRQRDSRAPGDLDRALADLASEMYGVAPAKFLEHAHYRAEAMAIRDDQAGKGGVSERDWHEIRHLLEQSWSSLWHAVNDTPE